MSKMGAVQQNYNDVRNLLLEKYREAAEKEEAAEEAAKLVDTTCDMCIMNALEIEILIYKYLPGAIQAKKEISDFYHKLTAP